MEIKKIDQTLINHEKLQLKRNNILNEQDSKTIGCIVSL